jgi:hypothetical protein
MLGGISRLANREGFLRLPILAVALVGWVAGVVPPTFHEHQGDEAGFFDAACPWLALEQMPSGASPVVPPPLWRCQPSAEAIDAGPSAFVPARRPGPGRSRSPPAPAALSVS